MIDEETLAQINGKYVMPEDAGPGWRELYETGEDMSLLEKTLSMTPAERILFHEHFRNQILEIRAHSPYPTAE